MFLQSLSADGYDGWQRLTKNSKISKLKASGLTSMFDSGLIYHESIDSYYRVIIQIGEDSSFEVEIKYSPMTYVQLGDGTTTKNFWHL